MNIREYDFFTNSANKVMDMAMSAFAKKSVLMNEKEITIACNRIEEELDIIIGNGFYYEYYLLKKIVDYSIDLKRLIIVSGQISYSYIAYLLGISTIDPLKKDYKAEMLFDYRKRLIIRCLHLTAGR